MQLMLLCLLETHYTLSIVDALVFMFSQAGLTWCCTVKSLSVSELEVKTEPNIVLARTAQSVAKLQIGGSLNSRLIPSFCCL